MLLSSSGPHRKFKNIKSEIKSYFFIFSRTVVIAGGFVAFCAGYTTDYGEYYNFI